MFREKRVAAGFIVGVIFLVFACAVTYVVTVQNQQTAAQLAHNNEIEVNLSNLMLGLVDAETGQRGYIITDNATYLAPYESSLATINLTNATLGGLVSGDSNLTQGYRQLQPIIREKLAELNETIFLRNSQNFSAAIAIVNSGLGLLYMNQIRAIIGGMEAHVTQLTTQENSLASTQATQRIGTAVFDAAVAAGGFCFAYYAANANLESERKARREAELLQDILSHDIRNYNQVSKMTAELLYDRFRGDPAAADLLLSLLDAIDGSTLLSDNAKELGRILAEGTKVKLHPIDVIKSLEEAMALVKKATKVQISEKLVVDQKREKLEVMADQLLEDVFLNLYSNSAKHSRGQAVSIKTTVSEEENGDYVKISISDDAKGIADKQKEQVFNRYLKTSSGRGLGMSIVHALVVERYKGKITVKDRVEGDYTQGLAVEISLRKATRT